MFENWQFSRRIQSDFIFESIMTKKRVLLLIGAGSVIIALAGAVWYGGRRKWELMNIGPESTHTSSLSAAYEEKRAENPEDSLLKYNLACFYYHQERFKEAEELLSEIMDTPGLDSDMRHRATFNLGNVLFRLSEKQQQPESALKMLEQSLRHYRTAVEMAREEQRYPDDSTENDRDAAFNYALAKSRIKILADLIEQQRKNQQQNKELFILLRELLDSEKQLRDELKVLSESNRREEKSERRNLLLKRQAENLKQLNTVRSRIEEMKSPRPSPAGSTI